MYWWLPVALAVLGLAACKQERQDALWYFEGSVMGTTYHVQVQPRPGDTAQEALARAIDSVLFYVDTHLTVYDTLSALMRVNRAAPGTLAVSADLAYVFAVSQRVYVQSNGFFDPTVGPVAWRWGFGPAWKTDSLHRGFSTFSLFSQDGNYYLIKTDPHVWLDFGGVAKGYGVDKLAWWLQAQGYNNFLIEVGGEVRFEGKHPSGRPWKVGVENPSPPPPYIAIVQDTSGAVATSGTYRQKKKTASRTLTHIVNPHQLSSARTLLVSVYDTSCTYADAWATALTAAPCDTALLLARQQGLSALLLCPDFREPRYLTSPYIWLAD